MKETVKFGAGISAFCTQPVSVILLLVFKNAKYDTVAIKRHSCQRSLILSLNTSVEKIGE